MDSEQEKLKLCKGCHDNFYNDGNNKIGVKRCWLFEKAQIVTRFQLDWWTSPVQPGAFTKVTTLNCHHAPGQYQNYTEVQLPLQAKTDLMKRGEIE